MTRPEPSGRSPGANAHSETDHCFSLALELSDAGGNDGYFRRVNASFTKAFGYRDVDLLGAPFMTFVHFEDRAATRSELHTLGLGQPSLGFENRFRRKDGDYRWLAWTAVPTPEGLVYAAARDITARKLEEIQARTRQAARSEDFLVSVSHDLQQPLALIRGQVQLIQRQLARGESVEPTRLEEGLGCVNAAVIRMRGMLQEMLDNALEQAGQPLGLVLSPTDLIGLTRAAVNEHQLAFEGHQFVVEADATELSAMVDGPRVQRILENLLSNAVKYSPRGGLIRVTVSSSADTAMAVIAVHDSGIGIPAADLPHVFDRFYRGANVVGCIAGNGLGLAGARHMVELQHGQIAAQSEEGQGSTFTVRLPLLSS